MSESRTIGQNVARARERLGLRQSDVAAAMKDAGFSWHQTTVSRVERDAQMPDAAEMLALQEVLDDALIEGTPYEMNFSPETKARIFGAVQARIGNDDRRLALDALAAMNRAENDLASALESVAKAKRLLRKVFDGIEDD